MLYTIKSISDDGVYYLVNDWYSHGTFWAKESELRKSMLFKRAQDAKASLTKLLKLFDEYKNDKFEVVEFKE